MPDRPERPPQERAGWPGAPDGLAGNRLREYLVASLLAVVIALIVVRWVGGVTIYDQSTQARRAELHQAILTNTLPAGETWDSLGANSLNLRAVTVRFAAMVQDATGWRLETVYQLIDLVGIFLGLLLLHRLVRRWFPPDAAIAGMLLMGTLLPLTMFLHVFHPWDRPAFALWAAMALAAVAGRPWLFLGLYVAAVVIKFDSLFAAGLPFFLAASRRNIGAPLARTAAVAGIGIAIMALLSAAFPGGQEPRDLGAFLTRNLAAVGNHGPGYPPLLTHGLLGVLGVLGWHQADAPARRLWLFGLALLLPHMVLTNFVEVRAQVGSTICMIPLALFAFRPSAPSRVA